MDPADSWEKLGDALLGPFERDIINGLTGAYRAMEPRIEQAFKRSLNTGNDTALKQLLILRQQLGQELSAMQLPPELAQTVNQALLDGQVSSDFWALAEMNRVKQEARKLSPEEAAQAFANATDDADLLLSPAMVQQNPSAMIAAAQRQNALSNYAAGGRGTQAFAALNRLVDVDLRGRIIGAVEFHLAQGDSWRQLRSTLQNSLELTKSRAQTVARTEMAAAMVEGTKLRYEAEGIQQVQWQSVGSSRTCGYCAPRHGKVYKLGDVVAPAHPNCRCTITPFDPKWVELGLIDLDQEAKARADVLADLEASGKKPISGASPFEKALGQENAPKGEDVGSFAAKSKPARALKATAAPKPSAPLVNSEAEIKRLTNQLLVAKPAQAKQIAAQIEVVKKGALEQQVLAKQAEYKKLNAQLLKAKPPEAKQLASRANALKREIAALQGEKIDEVKTYITNKIAQPTPVKPNAKKAATAQPLKFGETPKTTQDVGYDYKANWSGMYEKKSQFRRIVEDMDDWSGDGFKGVRAAQLQRAKDRGVTLNDWEEWKLKVLEKGEARTYGNMADRIEDFIRRAPKYDGEIYRGAGFDEPSYALDYIRQLGQGGKNLTIDSWTSERSVAESFASGKAGIVKREHQVLLKMRNKEGAPIENLSVFGGSEREVLQPSGVEYKIKKVTTKKVGENMIYEVEMETL